MRISRVPEGDKAEASQLARLALFGQVDVLNFSELAKVCADCVFVRREWESANENLPPISVVPPCHFYPAIWARGEKRAGWWTLGRLRSTDFFEGT